MELRKLKKSLKININALNFLQDYKKKCFNKPQEYQVLFIHYLLISVLGTHNIKSDGNNILNCYDELINHIKDNQSILK